MKTIIIYLYIIFIFYLTIYEKIIANNYTRL